MPVQSSSGYCGRFAPSPTGELHFGSMLAAVGSFVQARARQGQWLIRIDDIDPPREVPGAARNQIRTLESFGLVSDLPVQYQSVFGPRYQAALKQLLAESKAFHCGCTRKDLGHDGVYPGTCRNGLKPGRVNRSIRLLTDGSTMSFSDAIQGRIEQHPASQTGDFVIRRADGLIAYQLAVVLDDAAAGVTEVMRGADLIDSTGRQLMVYRALGLPAPSYAHLPVVVDQHGRKLSKSDHDDPVSRLNSGQTLRLVLRALGHEPPSACRSLEAQWQWAIRNWSIERVPRGPVGIGVHPG